MRIKAGGLQLRFNTFQQPSTWHTITTNYKTYTKFRFRDILNFSFSEKSLGLVYSPHFVYDF